MRIAVDAMGGDHAPREIVRGAIDYALSSADEVILVGDVPRLEREISGYGRGTPGNVRLADAPEVIGMGEHPATALRTKRRSSIVVATNLVKEGAGSQRELDVRKAKLETARATLNEAQAMLKAAKQAVEVAKASAVTIQTRIDDATLKSPVAGRVLYRLAEPGEVLASGGKVLTLVDLGDVYMEIFLPSEQAASIPPGAEGRITLDYAPNQAIPGYVSFVSPEAQFTPKQVETRSEREKLMFRVKIQIPRELASQHAERVKTGVRGVGYVKLAKSAVWPPWLESTLKAPRKDSTGR